VIQLEEAVERILAALPAPVAEEIPLTEADGRILTGRILSPVDLPNFDNSAVDGYAVRAEDVKAVTTTAPVRLRVIGKVAAGETCANLVGAGECVRLFTGSPLPAGADAVVMQEDTASDRDDSGAILINDSVKPWENIRLRGVDVKRGDALAEPGAKLHAGILSLLSAAGVGRLRAGQRPTVSLLATGSELTEPGQRLAPGKIYESNRVAMASLVRSTGAVANVLPLVADTPEATRAALARAFETAEFVVTSGGVSVGELDFVKSSFEQLGGRIEFWKIVMRPGKPFVFGRWREKFLFGLPGNPVSAFVTLLLLVRPALLRWQGAGDVSLPSHPGLLTEAVTNRGERRHFLRVKVDSAGRVSSAGLQASHAQASLALANGMIDVPAETTLPAATTVQVMRWT